MFSKPEVEKRPVGRPRKLPEPPKLKVQDPKFEREEAKAPYNRLCIFDLDGVLVDTRDLHYECLNQALVAHRFPPIPRALHLSTYDGLPTMTKLRMLGIDGPKRQNIWETKQKMTGEALADLQQDGELIALVDHLKSLGIRTAVASNSIRATTRLVLERLGLLDRIGFYASATEDIPKPSPSMYWSCMRAAGASAKTTVILEDSFVGQTAAVASGATLVPILNRADVKEDRILAAFPGEKPLKYLRPELQVVIPMAGEGSRFAQAGYTFPKPLIEIDRKPMIQAVVESLRIDAHYIFLVRTQDFEKYQLGYLLNLIAPGCEIVQIPQKTEGAACTVLAAQHLIDNDRPLLVVNSDQLIEWNPHEVMHGFETADAGVVTFNASHPKWSYVRRNEEGFVVEVAEKRVISDEATVGIYYWSHGSDFVRHGWASVSKPENKVNGEWYLAPVLNETIACGHKVRATRIEKMWGVGTPEDLSEYLRTR